MTIHEHDDDDDVKELSPAELASAELALADLEEADPEDADPDAPDSDEEFAEEVRDLVASSVPRVFALVEERGERADGRILYWGLEFDEEDSDDDGACAVVISASSFLRGGIFSSAESAQQIFAHRRKIRLVWTSTPATRPAEDPAY
ncbi:MAG: hypothetical protein ACT4NY_31160 [Pseudonocardiales bacterium]